MKLSEAYPTVEHAKAARDIVGLFSRDHSTDAILLTNSCARGAGRRSDAKKWTIGKYQ